MANTYKEPPKVDVENFIANDEFVTAVGKISTKNEQCKTTAYHYCDVWKFKDGKMSELKAFVIPEKS